MGTLKAKIMQIILFQMWMLEGFCLKQATYQYANVFVCWLINFRTGLGPFSAILYAHELFIDFLFSSWKLFWELRREYTEDNYDQNKEFNG